MTFGAEPLVVTFVHHDAGVVDLADLAVEQVFRLRILRDVNEPASGVVRSGHKAIRVVIIWNPPSRGDVQALRAATLRRMSAELKYTPIGET
jgi:hypothetical protein